MNHLIILGIGITDKYVNGLSRFIDCCKANNLEYDIVGYGKKWIGGDLTNSPGGGQKIIELENYLRNFENQLILVCDTFDLIPVGTEKDILTRYHNLCPNNEILFAAEVFCWPDKNLIKLYPKCHNNNRFLNSGSFMGYSNDIFKLIDGSNIQVTDDDQLFFTKKYLAGAKIKLDHNCEIFQALNGVTDKIEFKNNRIFNTETKTNPLIIHGNGPSKKYLNELENKISNSKQFPNVFVAAYIDSSATENYRNFINTFITYRYPNKTVHIYDSSSNESVKEYVNLLGYFYHPNISNFTFADFNPLDSENYLLIKQNYIINDKSIIHKLVKLIDSSHPVISPLIHDSKCFSYTNFWGDINDNGFYKRSEDYFQIICRDKLGLWNVPYVSGFIIMKNQVVELIRNFQVTDDQDIDLCSELRFKNVFMYLSNMDHYEASMD